MMDGADQTTPEPPPPGGATVGAELRRVRLIQGLTLDHLAERSGVPAPLLGALERGVPDAFPNPRSALRALRQTARTLGLDADRLVLAALAARQGSSPGRPGATPPYSTPTYSTPAGAVPANSEPTGAVPTGSMPAGAVPTDSVAAGSMPAGAVPTDSVAAGSMPAGAVPTGAVPTDSVAAGAVPAYGATRHNPAGAPPAEPADGPGGRPRPRPSIPPRSRADTGGRHFRGPHANRRRRVWAGAAVLLAVGGGTLVGVGASAQGHAPAPVHDLGTLPAAVAPVEATVPPRALAPASTPTTTAPPLSLPASLPLTLRIPAIGVSAPVVPLGRDADGSLQVPPLTESGVREAGWYHLGPTPGQIGPAVIVGHLDSYQAPGVFYALGALHPGATVQVTLQDGTVAVFRVDAVDQYSKASFPTQTVYGGVGYAGLRLITCSGAFDRATRHYESNIVVFASLIGPTGAPAATAAPATAAPTTAAPTTTTHTSTTTSHYYSPPTTTSSHYYSPPTTTSSHYYSPTTTTSHYYSPTTTTSHYYSPTTTTSHYYTPTTTRH